MKSLICDYIRTNINWYDELTHAPYNLKVKKEGKYVLFMYNQIESDFYIPLVREARGIIIDIERIEPVCYPFIKFGNYGEGYVDEIDWSTARVQEKIDGSIVKVWNDGEWHISSNSMIDAYKAVLEQSKISIGRIIEDLRLINYNALDPNYTHIFELISPYNKVVVDYGKTELYYIGRRNMITGQEERIPDKMPFKKPREYRLSTLQECITAAAEFGENEQGEVDMEGFVVVDDSWHRIKVKNPAYVAAHYIRSKQPTFNELFDVWRKNEIGEFLSVFPYYDRAFNFINAEIEKMNKELAISASFDKERKQYAGMVLSSGFKYTSLMFIALDKNLWTIEELLNNNEGTIKAILKRAYKNDM